MEMIYLDNNATTPLSAEVLDAMMPFMRSEFGNPSSSYALGNGSKSAIQTARENVGVFLGASEASEIVFTCSGTESDNWAILGSLIRFPKRKHVITTRVEHEAVRKVCEKLERSGHRISWLDVDSNGALDLGQLKAELCQETACLLCGNNEPASYS